MKKLIIFLLVLISAATMVSCTKSTDIVQEEQKHNKLYFRIESVTNDDSVYTSRVIVYVNY